MFPFVFLCKFAPMKRLGTVLIFLIVVTSLSMRAQDVHSHDHDHSHDHPHVHDKLTGVPPSVSDTSVVGADSLLLQKSIIKKPKDAFSGRLPDIYAWKITPRLGERILVDRDTSYMGFHQKLLVDGQDVAVSYLSNIGSPAQSKIFFNRPETSRFIFLDAFEYWRKNPEDNLFLNTKVPYSNILYQTAGGGESQEQRFMAEISSNFGKKLNVGFNFDYLYARGFYTQMFDKQINYDLYGSYIGDKYKMHVYLSNNNFTNSENGGIQNDLFITNPDSDNPLLDNFDKKPRSIPIYFSETWNKQRGRHIYVTNRYDLGKDTEIHIVNDSTVVKRKKADYISPASVVLTSHYTDQRRRIHSNDGAGLDSVYYDYVSSSTIDLNSSLANVNPNSVYVTSIDDQMAYWSFKNTLALAMNEGFKPWMKFGLTAFVEYDMRKYAVTEISQLQGFRSTESEKSFIIGGVLSKEKGENLFFNLSAEKNLLAEDFKLQGEVTGKVNLFGKNLSAKAKAYIKSLQPTFFEKKFGSKYFYWNNPNLENVHRVYVGGEITLPSFSFSRTKISGGVENVENYIYYAPDRLLQQSSKNIQIVSLRLDQELQAGILHWDNQIVYQATADDEVIPLPDLSIYSNLYITGKVAKVLSLQLGVDAHFYTRYYAPGYEPITMQFYNQREKKIGNFPISTAYLNLNLKNTRFFVMMYNVLQGIGNGESFTTLHYPVNPRMLKMGLTWKFNN